MGVTDSQSKFTDRIDVSTDVLKAFFSGTPPDIGTDIGTVNVHVTQALSGCYHMNELK